MSQAFRCAMVAKFTMMRHSSFQCVFHYRFFFFFSVSSAVFLRRIAPKMHSTPSLDTVGNLLLIQQHETTLQQQLPGHYTYIAPPCFVFFLVGRSCFPGRLSWQRVVPRTQHNKQTFTLHCIAFVSPSLVDWRTASQ